MVVRCITEPHRASESTPERSVGERFHGRDPFLRMTRTLLVPFQVLFLVAWSCFWISAALVVLAVTRRRTVPLAMARRCWAPGLLWAAGATLDVQRDREADGAAEAPCVYVMN